MTCKDCYHYTACHRMGKEIPSETCATFRDRRLILELPCDIGDEIWIVVTRRHKANAPEFTFPQRSRLTWTNLPRVLRDYGRTVFLTKEEAELAADAGCPEPSASAASAGIPLCINYPDNPDVAGCKLLTERLCETRGVCSFCNLGK